jgi:deoxyribonuclease V
MVLLTWPELELVEYKVARIATTMPYSPAFSPFVNIPRCWRRGSSSRKNRTCCLSTATVFPSPPSGRRQPFWPAGGCADHWRGEKTAVRAFEPLSDEPGALAPLMDKDNWHGSGAAKRAVIRCLSPPGTG